MLQKLRQILLTQYIGAIAIAIVAAHCIHTFIGLVISIFWHLAIMWRTPAGVFGESQAQAFDWPGAIYRFVDVFLNGAAAFGLIRWLYSGQDSSPVHDGAGTELPAPATTVKSS
jgi:hypothetical protein